MRFDEDGIRIYDCRYCQDAQWVHQRNPETGLADYTKKAVPCRFCRPDSYQAAMNPAKK